jgi:poly(A) polymerase
MTSELVFPPIFKTLCSLLSAEKQVYLVGGAVRDAVIGHINHDLDFVMPASIRRIARQVANALNGAFYMLDEEREIARVICQDLDGKPYSLDFSIYRGQTLEDDLRGRDFTINAMAVNLVDPRQVIDPLGGAKDLQVGLLKACGPASLRDDPLRVLRGIRLSLEFQFQIDPATLDAMLAEVPGLSRISPERQRDEFLRILEGKRAADAIRMLDQFDVIRRLLPEIYDLKLIGQSTPHIWNVWDHTLAALTELEILLDVLTGSVNIKSVLPKTNIVLAFLKLEPFRQRLIEYLSESLIAGRNRRGLLFLAALYHDAGKAISRQEKDEGNISFHGHDQSSANLVVRRARELVLSQVEINYLEMVTHQHMRLHLLAIAGGRPSRKAIYHFFRDTGSFGVDICLLSLADTLATYGETLPESVWLTELEVCIHLLAAWWGDQSEVVRPPRFLNGDDLQEKFGLKPGPQIGEILAALEEAQACGEVTQPSEAWDFVKNWLSGNISAQSEMNHRGEG